MKKNKSNELRERAEKKLESALLNLNLSSEKSSREIKELIHDLQVHQIELEMQNDELRKIQIELDESSKKYFDLFNLAPVGYLIINKNYIIKEVNLTAANLLGTKISQLKNKAFTKFILSEDQDIFYLYRKNILGNDELQKIELRLKRNNEVFWANLGSVVSKSSNGRISIQVAIEDISARKQAEMEVERSEKKYRNLIDTMSDGLGVQDKDGKITFMNNKGCEILGYSLDELVGKPITFLFDEENQKILRDKMVKRGISEQQSYEIAWLRKNGEKIDTLVTPSPLLGDNGYYEGSIAVFTDITERKTAEELLKKTNNKLSELNDEKDKLFSIIAHDLRSPFQGLLGMTEMIAERGNEFSPAEIIDFTKSLYNSLKNLNQLLFNLFQWAQIQKGTITFSPKEFSLFSSVKQCISSVAQNAKHKRIKIINEVPKVQSIFADEDMINTVLRNLISNAVKFTKEEGKVIIRARKIKNEIEEVSVKDSGVGISKEFINKLFKVGEKVSSKGTADEPSTGLGLLLCKEFIDKHGGRIWAESELGKGSTFTFILPVKKL